MAESKIFAKKTLLWSNSDGGWGTNVITLSSDDYNELEVVYKATNGTSDSEFHAVYSKGTNIDLTCVSAVSGAASNSWIMMRKLTRNSDVSFTPSLGVIIRWGASSGETGQTYFCFPIRIYGIK